MNLTEFLNEDLFDEYLPQGDFNHSVIPEGSRNATMSRFAGRVIKKYGDTEKAYQTFLEEAAKFLYYHYLSSTTYITAFVLVFPPLDEDDKYVILPYFWIPEDTLGLRVRHDHVPYDVL